MNEGHPPALRHRSLPRVYIEASVKLQRIPSPPLGEFSWGHGVHSETAACKSGREILPWKRFSFTYCPSGLCLTSHVEKCAILNFIVAVAVMVEIKIKITIITGAFSLKALHRLKR